MMQKNFFVVKSYNNADKYALAVLLLSDRIAGKPAPVKDWTRPYTPLTMTEKEELQRLLAAQGFYSGVMDGLIGDESRKAVKRAKKQSKKKCRNQEGQCTQAFTDLCTARNPDPADAAACTLQFTACCPFLADCQTTAFFDCTFSQR